VLLNGLRPVIRTGVLRENKTIISREQVLATTQRQKELLSEAKERSAGRTLIRGANAAPAGSVRDALRSGPKARTCYVCGKQA
jgi:hypothetical protein